MDQVAGPAWLTTRRGSHGCETPRLDGCADAHVLTLCKGA
jgi:hypothetical protein